MATEKQVAWAEEIKADARRIAEKMEEAATLLKNDEMVEVIVPAIPAFGVPEKKDTGYKFNLDDWHSVRYEEARRLGFTEDILVGGVVLQKDARQGVVNRDEQAAIYQAVADRIYAALETEDAIAWIERKTK